jgi:foldase protein PrsA
VLFGAIGYYSLYQKKSESSFSETISLLYPLPAAKVDQSYIWSHHFLQRLRFLTTFQSRATKDIASNIPTDKQLREKVMAGLIEDKIIFLEAQKRGISVSQKELDESYQQQSKATENLEKKINELYGMRPSDFKQVLAERILKEKLKAAVLTRVRVRHILTATESAANEAKRQIEGGKVFETAVREFSQDTQTKETGGDLGYWTKDELSTQISPGFEEAAFNGEVNKILGPIQSKYGYHIIQVTERTGNNYQTYEEWYASVKRSYKIKIYIPI